MGSLLELRKKRGKKRRKYATLEVNVNIKGWQNMDYSGIIGTNIA